MRLPSNPRRMILITVSIAMLISACGGGAEPPVELMIETPTLVANRTVVLKGTSFVPAGSSCPQSSEFIRIGTLGANQITYRNTATGLMGPVFTDLWVCNSGDGRTMRWTSNPISLLPGDNVITVTMTTPERTSSSSIIVRS